MKIVGSGTELNGAPATHNALFKVKNSTMHTIKAVFILTASLALAGTAQAQAPIIIFDSGSTGALGDLVITNDTTIVLPVDGILHYKSVTIKNNAAVGFIKNANNTPIYILSQGDVSIGGQIYVSGGDGNSFGPGLGGPGGFDGGRRGVNTVPPGDGQGPGGGAAGAGHKRFDLLRGRLVTTARPDLLAPWMNHD